MENPRDTLNEVGSTTRRVANEFKSDVKAAAKDARTNLRNELGDRYEHLRDQAKEMVSQSEGFVKEHPLSTVLGACAVGFIAGAILSRTSRH
jgi:ElaB/YqjD/DUF883 family membrane-anchored ribosome-binding protein